ncbi:MAG: RidA family protein [Nitrososphaeria archaeon]
MKRIDVPDLPKAGPYSHAVVSGGLVFVSGQIGTLKDRRTSFQEQFENAVGKIKRILEASGSSIDRVLKVTVYLADARYFGEMNALFEKHFRNAPARTTVICSLIDPEMLVELDVVAEV